MTTALVVLLMLAGALGWGAMIERLCGLGGSRSEQLSRALALGMGVLGWLAFFPALFHHLEVPALAAVPAFGLPGLLFLRRLPAAPVQPLSAWTWALAAIIVTLLIGDLLEGLSPPTDADSAAYHFANPKLFLQAGGLVFIPRAVDGAIPMLNQMHYMLALGLGGERAMTLWCMVSGWILPFAVYGVSRRWLDRDWALAVAAITLSLPAILAGAGTGQIETRTAAYCLAATAAVAQRPYSLRAVALAGLAAGFFVASKFTGLMFVAAVGVTLLVGRGWFIRGAVFAVGVLIAGSQWYGWNFVNTGDPVFPMLFGVLPYIPGTPWSAEQAAYIRSGFFDAETVVPRTLLWWLVYPIWVLLTDSSNIEAGRIGLGAFPLLAAPFALAGAWRFRARFTRSPLFIMATIVILFYSLWFFIGTSQRLRHYLPVVPIAIMVLAIAAERGTRGHGSRRPLMVGLAAVLTMQLAAQGLVALNHARRLVGGEDPSSFLTRNLRVFPAVELVNATLGMDEKVLTDRRDIVYYFDVPVFYAHPTDEARVVTRNGVTDIRAFWQQLHQQNITHVLLLGAPSSTGSTEHLTTATRMGLDLLSQSCASVVAEKWTPASLVSRTLALEGPSASHWRLIALRPQNCALEP